MSVIEQISDLLRRVPEPEPNLSHETAWPHRLFYKTKDMVVGAYETRRVEERCSREEADLVASQTDDGMHAPAIDLDFPCRLLPSGTEGHFHLYLDRKMPLKDYLKLLKVMVDVGLVEDGFYKMTKQKGRSYLRVPNKPKGKSRVPDRGYY